VPAASMRELLEAGVHFGHQTRRWNPKMRRYIFSERSGIYIIDLQKSLRLLDTAHDRVAEIASRGGSVLFVGTKKQARDAVAEQAQRAGMPYVNHRWLGGLLTNWRTISSRIEFLHELRRQRTEGQLDLLPTKERMTKLAELEKLETNLGGVADMRRLPQAVFVIDLKAEALAVRESRRLGIPLIGLVDTNCDPDEVDLVVPGNDDAMRSCALICRVIADGIREGRGANQPDTPLDGSEAEAIDEAVAEALAVAGISDADDAAAPAENATPGEPAAPAEPAATAQTPVAEPAATAQTPAAEPAATTGVPAAVEAATPVAEPPAPEPPATNGEEQHA
jgi:small subunit ribosomal protein S2